MSSASSEHGEYIGIDFGLRRIGLARITTYAQIGEPLTVVDTSKNDIRQVLTEYIAELEPIGLVVGLPRSISGNDTEQTELTRKFATEIARQFELPVYVIDEAGSSIAAKEMSTDRHIDAHAAVVILEDFVQFKNKQSLRI